jgi:hypothetical protein
MQSFENDAALDWLADLEESNGLDLVVESLETPREDGYLDADVGVTAIAAAEVVAALVDRPSASLPDGALEWVAQYASDSHSALVPKAIAVIGEVLGTNSELRELWEENEEDFPTWESTLLDLKARLASAQSA